MESYLLKLKERLARDKKLAVYFNNLKGDEEEARKNKQTALQLMRRIMIMKKEIENAEANAESV